MSDPALFGDDKYLNGLPKDLDEAIDALLTFYQKDIPSIATMSEDEFIASSHFAAGLFIRNAWFLWWHKAHKWNEFPKTQPAIVAFFNEAGIIQPDDMCGIILKSVYRRVRGIDIDLPGQVRHYTDFYDNQD